MRIPSAELQEQAKRVVEKFVDWADGPRSAIIEKIDVWDQNYRVKRGSKTVDTRANTADAMSHENVETLVPRIFNIMTDNGDLNYEIAPVDRDFDEELVKAPNALIKSDLKMSGSRQKLLAAIRACVKYGTIVGRVPWEQYTRTQCTRQYSEPIVKGVDENGNIIVEERFLGYEKTEQVVYEGVNLELVDLKACHLDPHTADVDKAQAIVEDRLVNYEELVKNKLRRTRTPMQMEDGSTIIVERTEGHYFNLDKVKERLDKMAVSKEVSTGDPLEKPQDKDVPRKQVPIQNYWGFFDFDGDGKAEDCIITIADKDFVIRLEPSEYPRRPFIVCRYIALEGQTYGLGVLELMEKPQEVINDVMNQALDNVTMSLLRMWLLQENSNFTDSKMAYEQDKIIRVADTQTELVPLAPPYVTKEHWPALEMLKEGTRGATSAYRSLQAQPMDYGTTATEISTMTTEASARIVIAAISMESEWIVPHLTRIVEYNREFMGDMGKIVKLTNDPQAEEQFMGIEPIHLAGQWDFTPLGAQRYQRMEKMRKEVMELAQSVGFILAPYGEMLQQMPMNPIALIQALASTYDLPEADMEKIFPKQEEQPQGGKPTPEEVAMMEQIAGGMGAQPIA